MGRPADGPGWRHLLLCRQLPLPPNLQHPAAGVEQDAHPARPRRHDRHERGRLARQEALPLRRAAGGDCLDIWRLRRSGHIRGHLAAPPAFTAVEKTLPGAPSPSVLPRHDSQPGGPDGDVRWGGRHREQYEDKLRVLLLALNPQPEESGLGGFVSLHPGHWLPACQPAGGAGSAQGLCGAARHLPDTQPGGVRLDCDR